MTNDYQSLIQLNPIVQYAMNGFQRSSWCNISVLSMSSVKNYAIHVFANTPQDAMFLANQLKAFIEQRPMMNTGGFPDDISIGIRQPIKDPISMAYKVDMIMTAGMLRMQGSSSVPSQPSPISLVQNDREIINHGLVITNNGKQITN